MTINRAAAVAFNKKHRNAQAEVALALLIADWQQQHGLGVDGKLGPLSVASVLETLGVDPIDDEQLESDHVDDPVGDAPIAIDDAGWASGAAVSKIPSRRDCSLHVRADGRPVPVGVVWHWTATNANTGWACARRIVDPPTGQERAASWHLLITRTGELLHSVPFRRGSWHAGGATAARFGYDAAERRLLTKGTVSANNLMIGIELENVGEVRAVDGRWRGWPFGKDGRGPEVPASDTVKAGGKTYHDFPKPQQIAARRLLRALVAEYDLSREAVSWSHQRIDPTRKTDPGPVWMDDLLPALLDDVFG